MLKRFGLFAVVTVIAIVGNAQAGPPVEAATAELRQEVLDSLSAANEFEFEGTIEFTKRMKLSADPGRVQMIEHARGEVERCKAHYATQMDALKGAESDEIDNLRETVTAAHQRSLAQHEDMIRYAEAWSTTGIEVEQRWSVIYVSADDLRVEFSSRAVAPETTSLIPLTHTQAITGGKAWSRLTTAVDGVLNDSPANSVENPEFVRQAKNELAHLLNPAGNWLSAEMLTDVKLTDDAIVATFDHEPADDASKHGTTVLTFERADDGLRLRRCESTTGAHQHISTYDDYRTVDGRAIAYVSAAHVAPIEPAGQLPSASGESAMTYRIVTLEFGVTEADIDRLAQPVADASE